MMTVYPFPFWSSLFSRISRKTAREGRPIAPERPASRTLSPLRCLLVIIYDTNFRIREQKGHFAQSIITVLRYGLDIGIVFVLWF
jgi:hypothetical protein